MRSTQPWKFNRSRILRSNATSAEAKLWFHLRDRRLGGFKFVRQFPIGDYFADFACREMHVVVEIDGGTHGTPSEIAKDRTREEELVMLGYKIVRINNADIYKNIDGVLDQLLAALQERS
ncbi:endonuclease domain-containing protein [Hyphomicrobium sp. MC8b]|uniref:endonuclease domain-containing protein n=1 Tax=Hyphomicrobium sp. MC8b TaxID=300273 RepID=UPI00391D47EC